MECDHETTKTILVVEDQRQIAFFIGRVLEQSGYLCEHANNGQEALDSLRGGLRPDMILLDIVMPVMDGFGLLDELHKEDDLKDIPTVMLSSLDSASNVMKAMKKGAMHYCTKPIDKDDLLATIAGIFSSEIAS